MYKHILVPVDGSQLSERAAEAGIRLAKAIGACITAVHVVPETNDSPLEAWAHRDTRFPQVLERSLESRAVLFLESVREAALRAGVACDCHLLRGEAPHREIILAAQRHGCDLIVMASHRLGAEPDVMLDGQTIKVLANGMVPVLVHH
jgi:nucleotide-binding universal stress UspA family protein